MGTIRVLDEQLANMIAAGEVVERPASVVKELVENAIDAKATSIEIHVEEGGLELIRIVDNGHGMDRDDCLLALERHATSKISTQRDLFRIRTLGFRGEALPSIAAVSRMELTSNRSSREIGTRLLVEGGAVSEVADAAAVQGTEICVRSLFFNTPARLKYMKSIATEVGHISDYVNRLALTHPSISFLLTHNGKNLLQTTGDGKLLHVMAAIYGVQIAKLLIPISGETLDFRWNGFLSKTEVTRANRSYLSTLVNGRYVRSYSLNNAIMRGYHTLLPIGRFPIVALQIEMDPTLVDVNVHPAKLEARFSKEDELCTAIEQSVKTTLRQGLGIVRPMETPQKAKITTQVVQPQFDLTFAKPAAETQTRSLVEASPRLQEWMARQEQSQPLPLQKEAASELLPLAQSRKVQEASEAYPRAEQEQGLASSAPEAEKTGQEQAQQEQAAASGSVFEKVAPVSVATAPSAFLEGTSDSASPSASLEGKTGSTAPLEGMVAPLAQPDAEQASEPEQNAAPVAEERVQSAVPVMYPVGQVHGTYIVAQNDEGMYLIDQHAAQERIFYEYFMAKLAEEGVASQMMLFPHTVEFTTAEAARLEKRLSLLQSFGLEVEAFGGRTFIVRAHPHWFPEGAELEVIEELIQFVLEAGEQGQAHPVQMREKAAIMMSCKASIKANRFLTHAEMESLLNQLRETSSPFTCPHGRPIVIHFTGYDLEKMFKRVM
ncbi:DNA mismatch repair endonuclease MutL [Brevibacillus parabrevis]|uniref:DNA mismatch repair endonuclease MutL n=1 Tax=Brevibacillus parabrevis TaxID=54914 RepID=UPI0028535E42|nr:DNA mismatch repair endonuclease MutL [Brevibacillus parabrevis]MDR4999515.1 DNA mismatch repair endonuclease MutL [Brevibacillus parabrevis]MED2253924.1 DNA mismatch repair endonuclease MutL [Brevibacillus parabrevis]